jgi:glycosyltransferase involved in cell wall biosynthesis
VVTEFFLTRNDGAERVLHQLVDAMLIRGDTVTVVAFENPGDVGIGIHSSKGIQLSEDQRLYYVCFKSYGPLDWSWDAIRHVEDFGPYDVIFTQHYYHFSAVFATMVGRRFKIPVVLKPIGINGFTSILQKLIYGIVIRTQGKYCLKNASLIVPTSVAETTELIKAGAPMKKVVTILSGIEPLPQVNVDDSMRRFFRVDGHKPVLLFIGREEKLKGIDTLIKALKIILKDYPDLRCVTIGNSDKKFVEGLKDEIKALGDNLIRFGPVQDRWLISCGYNLADIFILPSRTENSPLVVKEAISVGCPVIATDTGGTRELIANDEGIVIEKSRPDELAAAIVYWLDSKYPRPAPRMIQTSDDYIRQNLYQIDRLVLKKPDEVVL